MNHIIIKEHESSCPAINKFGWYSIEKHIIYADSGFTLLECCNCLRGYLNKPEFIKSLLKNKYKKLEYINFWDVQMSYKYDNRLKQEIRDGTLFTRKIHECNYTYSDNAGQIYFIVSKISYYKSKAFRSEKLDIIYKEAKEYLEKLNLDSDNLMDDLELLYDFNRIPDLPDTVKVCGTITELNKLFRKKIKEKKHETS